MFKIYRISSITQGIQIFYITNENRQKSFSISHTVWDFVIEAYPETFSSVLLILALFRNAYRKKSFDDPFDFTVINYVKNFKIPEETKVFKEKNSDELKKMLRNCYQ